MSRQDSSDKRRIGFFGGSFDPIHKGHLELAKEILAKASLQSILLCPARQAPLRQQPHHASPSSRLKMVRIATKGIAGLEVTDAETSSDRESNYTWDTLQKLKEENPGTEIMPIIGTDQLAKLHDWRHAEKLARDYTFIALTRPGHEFQTPQKLPKLRVENFSTAEFDVSSTKVRELIKNGMPYEHLLPKGVTAYLNENKLYQ